MLVLLENLSEGYILSALEAKKIFPQPLYCNELAEQQLHVLEMQLQRCLGAPQAKRH